MYYAQIRKYDTANGPGIRSSLFVSGCTHTCKGCFNEAYKDFRYGQPWTKQVEDDFIDMIKSEEIKGVTILGGEPMDQLHDDDLLTFVKRVKTEVGKRIWIYSGYTYEQLLQHDKRRNILSFCDVLVDGLFIFAQKDLRLRFRGSRNQRIIDIGRSFETGDVQLWVGYE
ncbi:MAG: anaerobic ribonucleoside-triphosphate reductase activating protein [Defluviitaleaceae bacterium]|nr:anaerobic ribonucleoside-triphosphate reductase activating protein [Defluviitaleaceae bacterium]